MKVAAITIAALMLTACQSEVSTRYVVQVDHPFEIRESFHEIQLGGLSVDELQARAWSFGVGRPNNGSTFAVTADSVAAELIHGSLMAAGVAGEDIIIVSSPQTTTIRRIDRIAIAKGCYGAPEPESPFVLDDGFGHSNADSMLLGCAVRRNIAAMTDDPRMLFNKGTDPGRDGAKADNVYKKWLTAPGGSAGSTFLTPTPQTSGSGK
jgi:type IV pilus biogenesis protein CpaD/CtpE